MQQNHYAEVVQNIPQAVAQIVVGTFSQMRSHDDDAEAVQKLVLELTEKLTAAMRKALTNT